MQGKRGSCCCRRVGFNKGFAFLYCVVGQEWESQELCNRVGVFLLTKSRSQGKGPQDPGRAPGHAVALMEALDPLRQ